MKGGNFKTQIRHATLIRAAPEVVYDAFTTGQGLDGWFTQERGSSRVLAV